MWRGYNGNFEVMLPFLGGSEVKWERGVKQWVKKEERMDVCDDG